ncbi:3-oxoacyl-[acyl-carrier-protein] synthase 2 [Actinomyces bovis]|uniref:3-oxoacyl-[acyl-carrier-protein] synthase 2 n=1 Tax=Actinomyces bovis TaxID=1658 RepID=A0ABY1VPH3_9ACTO|nr:type I polyketide synthase [Actinomyces bovis]SPT54031.1 3-oxoacyl-[acyl-carrier-protein] synthase 2 [Actinomyces bovis]VEG53817.1 3-oxoacyl-[acyl-carrier-protein] synthase 2 [Actinomyces israelii]
MTATPTPKTTFARLTAGEPYVLAFGGQATPWRQTLRELVSTDRSLSGMLRELDAAVATRLAPVATDLLTITPRGLRLLDDNAEPASPAPTGAAAADTADVSVPGILLAQHAILVSLAELGLNLTEHAPASAIGHSQGVLGVALLEALGTECSEAAKAAGSTTDAVQVHALARLIGAAAARTTARAGLSTSGDATPMLSVRGVTRTILDRVLARVPAVARVSVGVTNGRAAHILSGRPADLELVVAALEQAAARSAQERKDRRRGGAVLAPVTEYLATSVPFHTELLAQAVTDVVTWADRCGLDTALARDLAAAVLIDPVDWPATVHKAMDAPGQPRLVLDLGPGNVLSRLTEAVLAGTGAAVVPAGTAAALDDLLREGAAPTPTVDRARFAPKLTRLPDGRLTLDTAFTRLTGRSAVLLAGMTPTTVDPEIVAAAANAGYWAELAGGGQVTPGVLAHNLEGLQRLLEPGRTAAFNAMFMDRYLWNLHLGAQRLLSKARGSGAPVDGIVVSAGIPELDEAVALLKRFHAEGFPYVAFKPGTVDQIRQVLAIAKQVPDAPVIMQVEDGHAGGHHSWEDLDTMLLATYDAVRQASNVVLVVGGGIGTPERAADYLTGRWALPYGTPAAPVDGVMVGTAAMTALEAKTNEDVKQLLVDTPGTDPSCDGGWVASGASQGGMTSGLSHLRADLYEIDNSSARASRLIQELAGDEATMAAHREEMIAALAKTAKPYFGDVEKMTYQQWATRYAELCVAPHEGRAATEADWADEGWYDRFLDLLHRVEARLATADTGEIPTLFADHAAVLDADAALASLAQAYPAAATVLVEPSDAAWFVDLCRKHPKPVPFVPVVDADILRWWGTDSLWQSQDPRYTADQVRIIPGPVSVAGITTVNEPIGDLLGRFETAAVEALQAAGATEQQAASRLSCGLGAQARPVADADELVRCAPHVLWNGHLTTNPARVLDPAAYTVTHRPDVAADAYDLDIHLDTHWDQTPGGDQIHAVRRLVVPLRLQRSSDGAVPLVDPTRVPETMNDLLRTTAGVGAVSITGDLVEQLPAVVAAQPDAKDALGHPVTQPFGTVHARFTLADTLGADHAAVTADALPASLSAAALVPDALLGPCWPVVYAALGSVVEDGMPLIEGLLGAVHLDHTVDLRLPLAELSAWAGPEAQVQVDGWVAALEESSAGRVVDVRLELADVATGQLVALMRERFAIRGRAQGTAVPSAPELAGGTGRETVPAARRLLRRVRVTAPADMTAFARVTGDFNPIHTSYHAAKVAGMQAPLVHGMWLSATAQQVAASAAADGTPGARLIGWTYTMHGTVELLDEVEVSVERTGLVRGGGQFIEVTCRVDGEVVSRGTAVTEPEPTAYVYPGQGIQTQGMGLDEMNASKAAREVWERADAHTRAELGFSVIALVRDNPTEMTARGVTYRHPEGLLNLTQFTQVALATVAMATTARLAEAGALVEGAAFAGHSLGEYTALSAYGRVMPVETTISIVFQRGSTMHTLVERDEHGASRYRMGALRPNQAGIKAEAVEAYVKEVSERTGEFLQIVNYNLAGVQYAIAGTNEGLEALATDARARAEARGGKNPFMYVPGIDVPFHSEVLRPGVPEFRERLLSLVPQDLDVARLEGHYVPNLVARPFELSRDFAQAILEVVPSEPVRELLADWESWSARPTALARVLLVELLAWQFASPVRWIETQDVLFKAIAEGGLGIKQVVEMGLAASPTLANLASQTLRLPAHAGRKVVVYNARRDEARVLATDTDSAVEELEPLVEETAEASPAPEATPQAAPAAEAAEAASAPAPAAPAAAAATGPVEDLEYSATDALTFLLAHSARIRPEQIGATDTTETLTNGVSSRRNQLLMDLGTELQLASIDGAADADMTALAATVAKGAPGYKPFGPVLTEAVRTGLGRVFGPSGVRVNRVAERVKSTWGLGAGWASHVTAALVLGTREGASMRGEDLASLGSSAPATNAAAVDALIDAAVQAVASERGIAVAKASAAGGAGGAVVDSAALDAFAAAVTGEEGVLATTARTVLSALGLTEPAHLAADAADEAASTRMLVAAVDAELGAGWLKSVTPAFDPEQAVLIDDRWATAREDLARLGNGETSLDEARRLLPAERFTGLGQAVADQAAWWAKQLRSSQLADAGARAELAEAISQAAGRKAEAGDATTRWAQDVAVVTGVAPGSIAAAVTGELLAGGATVVATSSRLSHERLAFATKLFREHASAGARLWIVPANLASYRDVDALADWVGNEQVVTAGGVSTLVKEALVPTLLFPFAAPRVMGSLADAGPAAESQTRLLLWSVERTIAALSTIGTDTHVDHRLHVVLPGSPNRGIFGGDGAYGEVKSALDAVVNRWHSEKNWSHRVTLAHPRIGWVRGTGLMGGNDPLVAAVEAAGVRTWSTAEMATELLTLCTPQLREQAAQAPLQADFTGGLGEGVDLVALRERAATTMPATSAEAETVPTIKALPSPAVPTQPTAPDWGEVKAELEDMVVVVSTGEVSTWGSGRTRREAELGMSGGEAVSLTAAGTLELAWAMGLLTWQDSPKAGWYDVDGELVDESEIAERYADEVAARCGIREFVDDGVIATIAEEDVPVYLEKDITFTVSDEATARTLEAADPEHTRVAPEVVEGAPTGEWQVTRLSGSLVRVPRRAALSRTVGGQFPQDFDPARWGIPAAMVEGMDNIAAWNLVTAVDAFLSAGFSPAELLQAVHPSDVASTQGTGFGGMESMRKMFVGRLLGEERPSDILQEALPNVVAAHVMQSFIGGYGSMVQPVSACATAAVSIEEGWDKIALGKADVVVAGAIDDISIESVVGFGNMNATAEAAAMYRKGISARHFSRANDRRRGGFVEAEGGGTVILARATVAAELGLPVAGVVGFVSSYADGAHTSIPAPGLGALGAGRGGQQSRLARALAALGVEADDIAVVSKHDTSTKANDPNESELHTRLARALGRTEGNPLVAVSQKSVTGHAKGGAAVFQVAGLTEILATGLVPGNASLDVVDAPLEKDVFWVWPRTPMRLAGRGGVGGRVPGAGPVRAGLLTSLGFGHVSGLIAMVHPGAFEAALRQQGGEEAVSRWLARANDRLAAGTRRRRAAMIGRAPFFKQVQGRRLGEATVDRDPHEVEAAMLLDPTARLGADGTY